MRAIIIGAGRGSRLMPTTARRAQVLRRDPAANASSTGPSRRCKGRRLHRDRFIGGYRIDTVQRDYPDFVFRHNARLGEQQHPGLADVRRGPDGPAVRDCSYSDILFTRGRRARAWCNPGTSWRSASIPTGASTTSRPHPASAARRGEGDHPRAAASTRVHRDHPLRRTRPASSSASPSSARRGARQFREFYHRRKWRVLGQALSRGRDVPEGVPDPHVPGHDRARRSPSATSTRPANTARSTRRKT